MKTPIIFFGASAFVLPPLDMLQKKYDVKLVLTTDHLSTDPVPAYAKAHNLPYLSVSKLSNPEINRQLSIINCQCAILAHFGLIIPQSVLDLFPQGIINIHPSLLPQYRGPTPGQQAILDGKEITGVSIMRLDKNVDHGPLLAQEEEPILPTDTKVSLYNRLFAKGTVLLEKVLPDYLNGTLQPKDQDHSLATFSPVHISRQTGFINSQSSIINSQLRERMLKAYYPWPGVWTITDLKGKEVRLKLLPKVNEKNELMSTNIKDYLLLQAEGKKPMSYKDFLNGYPEKRDWLEKLVAGSK